MRSNSGAGIFRRERPVAGQRGVEIGIGHLDQSLELAQLVIGERSRSRHPQSGRGSDPSRACRGASSETTAACGGHRARGSIVSIPSFPTIQSNAKSPDVPGGVDIAIVGARCQPHFAKKAVDCAELAGLDEANLRSFEGFPRDAPCSPQSAVCAGHEPSRRRSQAGQAARATCSAAMRRRGWSICCCICRAR